MSHFVFLRFFFLFLKIRESTVKARGLEINWIPLSCVCSIFEHFQGREPLIMFMCFLLMRNNTQANIQTFKQTNEGTNEQTNKQTNKRSNKQKTTKPNKQTNQSVHCGFRLRVISVLFGSSFSWSHAFNAGHSGVKPALHSKAPGKKWRPNKPNHKTKRDFESHLSTKKKQQTKQKHSKKTQSYSSRNTIRWFFPLALVPGSSRSPRWRSTFFEPLSRDLF